MGQGWIGGVPDWVREKIGQSKRETEKAKAEARGYKEDRNCENCGKQFGRTKLEGRTLKVESWSSYNSRRFCSLSCMAKAREKSRGNATTEKKCEHCSAAFAVRGKRRREEARFCSQKCRTASGDMSMPRERHPNWKGGVTEENARLRNEARYKAWRDAVYRRDNWTCQKCGLKCKGKKIIAHHIKSFRNHPSLRYDIDNGQTLCRPCHKIVHSEIGESTRFKKKSEPAKRPDNSECLKTLQ